MTCHLNTKVVFRGRDLQFLRLDDLAIHCQKNAFASEEPKSTGHVCSSWYRTLVTVGKKQGMFFAIKSTQYHIVVGSLIPEGCANLKHIFFRYFSSPFMTEAHVLLHVWNVSPRYSLALLCVEIQYKSHYLKFWLQDISHIQRSSHYPLITRTLASETSLPLSSAQCGHETSLAALLRFFARIPESKICLLMSHRDVRCKPKSVLRDATLREVSRNLLLLISELQVRASQKPQKGLATKTFTFVSAPFYIDEAKIGVDGKTATTSLAFSQLLEAYHNKEGNLESDDLVWISFHSEKKIPKTTVSFEPTVAECKPLCLFDKKRCPIFFLYPCAPPFASRKLLLSFLKFIHSQQRVLSSTFQFYHSRDPTLARRDVAFIENHVIRNCAACKPFLTTFA